jgi:hypothetical protein
VGIGDVLNSRLNPNLRIAILKSASILITTAFTALSIQKMVELGGTRLFALNSILISVAVLISMIEFGLSGSIANQSSQSRSDSSVDDFINSLIYAIKLLCRRAITLIIFFLVLYFLGIFSQLITRMGFTTAEGKWVFIAILTMSATLPLTIFSSALLGFNSWDKVVFFQIINAPMGFMLISTISWIQFDPPTVFLVGPFSSLVVAFSIFAYFLKTQKSILQRIPLLIQLHSTKDFKFIKKTTRPYTVLIFGMAIILNSDKFIIARFGTFLELENYAIMSTLFSPIYALASTLIISRWSNFATMRNTNRLNIKSIVPKALLMLSAYFVYTVIAITFFDPLKSIIWGDSVTLNYRYLILFSVFTFVCSLQALFGVAIASEKGFNFIARFMIIAVPINILLKIMSVSNYGLTMLLVINSCIIFLFLVIPSLRFIKTKI